MTLTRRTIWLFALGMAMIGLLALGTGAPIQASTPLNPARKGTYIPMASPPPGAQQVKIGFYPVAIYDLDQASNTFYADTYVWLTTSRGHARTAQCQVLLLRLCGARFLLE